MNKRIFTHQGGLFFEYKIVEQDFKNQYFKDEPWHIKEYWGVFVRLTPKLFEFEDLYYDGHTVKSITLLGITLGKSYSYDSRPIASWKEEEKNQSLA